MGEGTGSSLVAKKKKRKKERNERKKLHQPSHPHLERGQHRSNPRFSYRTRARCRSTSARLENVAKHGPTATFIKDTNEIPAGGDS